MFNIGSTIGLFPRKRRAVVSSLCVAALIVIYQVLATFYLGDELLDLLNYRRLSQSATASIDAFKANAAAGTIWFYEKFKYDTSLKYPAEYDLHKDLLKIPYGTKKGALWDSISDVRYYDADPRLIWSVYIDQILSQKKKGEKIPFTWYDWADFHEYNKLLSLDDNKVGCDFLFRNAFTRDSLRAAEDEIGEELFTSERRAYDADRWYETAMNASDGNVLLLLTKHCAVDERYFLPQSDNNRLNGSMSYKKGMGLTVKDLFDKVRPEVYQFQARSFVLNTLQHPLSITVMKRDEECYQYLVDTDSQSRETVVSSGLVQKFVDKNSKQENTDIYHFDHIKRFKEFTNSEVAQEHKVEIAELSSTTTEDVGFFMVNETDFEFDAFAKIKELEARSDKLSPHERSYLDSLKFSTSTHYAFSPKFFHESSHVQSFKKFGGHFDKRFFNGPVIYYPAEMELRLESLVRNFQKFVHSNGLLSWLAHGTLFGWAYNGRSFPWDNDGDMQMPIKHLNLLAQYFNQTVVLEDPSEGNGKFLIDVGSSITTRINGNGYNNIDARFIDIDSGLYIDITGLSVSSTPVEHLVDYYKAKSGSVDVNDIKHRDPNLIAGKTDLTLTELYRMVEMEPSKYPNDAKRRLALTITRWNNKVDKKVSPDVNLTPEQRYNMNHELKMYNCRNSHFVTLDLVNPLVETMFHGVPALVPEKYVSVLKNEYNLPAKYGFIKFKLNAFIPEFGSWIGSKVLQKAMNKNQIDANLSAVYNPINALSLDDILKLLKNMATIGDSATLASIHNSLSSNQYRGKELDISYDTNLKRNERIQYLNMLRLQVGATIGPSQKDPWLHKLESRIWDEMQKENKEDCKNAKLFVDNKKAFEIWDSIASIASKTAEFLDASRPSALGFTENVSQSTSKSNLRIDFNRIGTPICVPGKASNSFIFKGDPKILSR